MAKRWPAKGRLSQKKRSPNPGMNMKLKIFFRIWLHSKKDSFSIVGLAVFISSLFTHVYAVLCKKVFLQRKIVASLAVRPAIAWPSDSHEQIPNFFESVWKKWWESYSNVYQHHHRSIKHQGLRIWWRCNDILTLRESTGTFPFPTFWPLACNKCLVSRSVKWIESIL